MPDLRRDTTLSDPLAAEPLALVRRWIDEANARQSQPNPTAMTLATVDPDGRPSARMLICRGFDFERGFFVFYTDRHSRKGRALRANAQAALVFHWDALERQIRIEGPVVPSPDAESDAYFAGRPREAQVAAWSSRQSEPIGARADLVRELERNSERYAIRVPRPPNWGGYRVWAESVELWIGQPGRVHDRALWTRKLEPVEDGFRGSSWEVARLQP